VIADLSGYAVSLLLGVLGVRVYQHAAALPDRMIATFFICLGLGVVPALLGGRASLIPMAFDRLAHGVGHGVLSLGFCALALFVWKCFGPASAWRQGVAIVVWVSLAVLFVAQGYFDGFLDGKILRITSILRGLVIGWAFAESLRYRGQLRKRLALGLADPIVTNRFTLWCLWTGALFLSLLVVISFRWLVGGIDDASIPLMIAIRSILIALALTSAVSLFLAFFPPRRYAERIRRRALV
jgi:hypothetical protein